MAAGQRHSENRIACLDLMHRDRCPVSQSHVQANRLLVSLPTLSEIAIFERLLFASLKVRMILGYLGIVCVFTVGPMGYPFCENRYWAANTLVLEGCEFIVKICISRAHTAFF